MTFNFTSATRPADDSTRPALWFLFRGFRLLVCRGEIPEWLSPEDAGLSLIRRQFLGLLNGSLQSIPCYCGELSDDAVLPDGCTLENLRALYATLEEPVFWLAGRAVQIVDWDRNHQFCGHCGQHTIQHANERAKICPDCGLTSYPRLSPAVIVRVQRTTRAGPQILLARAKRFPSTTMYSVLAGFVEPGETLEECVQREIFEETGLTVENIRYFGSQPWPFPNSLMIAFTADYAAGALMADPHELEEAGWFSVDALPLVPPPPSIANRLITAWREEVAREATEPGRD